MRSTLFLSFLLLQFFCACDSTDKEKRIPSSENDVDAARNFIRSALDGNWAKARQFMIRDSLNNQLLDTYEERYQQRMNATDKRGYREASINMFDVRPLNDTMSIVNYSNSYMKKNDSLRVTKIKGEWLVDFKFSFPKNDSGKTSK
ncbi:MAG: hypothetical protein NVSMB67_28290 [Flavisolibacter sp.]